MLFGKKKDKVEESPKRRDYEWGYSPQTIAKRLNDIKETINANSSMSDTNTRSLLVEPFLDAFGWKTSDNNIVTSQFREPDYKLLPNDGYDNSPIIVIVKRYGSPVLTVDNLARLKSCAENEYAQIAILTDGVCYNFFVVDLHKKLDTQSCYTFDLSRRTNLGGTSNSSNDLLVNYFAYQKFHSDSSNRANLVKAIREKSKPIEINN